MRKNNKCFYTYSLLLSLIVILSCTARIKQTDRSKGNRNRVIPVILDTDISGDYDDVGAVAMLHALADNGEAKILATIGSNLSPLVVPTIEIFNIYYGRPRIPIGVIKGSGVTQDSRGLHWPDSLMAHYPHTLKTNSDAPDAISIISKSTDATA